MRKAASNLCGGENRDSNKHTANDPEGRKSELQNRDGLASKSVAGGSCEYRLIGDAKRLRNEQPRQAIANPLVFSAK
jgi:hypothetical protein